jgi:psp operon transcriptional activator
VYRADDPDRPVDVIAFDPFDSPFRVARAESRPAVTGTGREPLLPTDLDRRLVDTERQFLEAALRRSRYNQRVAADLLGLNYHQFRGRLRKHDLSGRAPGNTR